MKPLRRTLLKYRGHPGSLALFLLVLLSAVLTVGVLFSLLGYILIRGIPQLTPSLFSLTYTTENVSMLPAILNTVTMTALSLLLAVPLGVGSAIYLVEYAKRGNRLVELVRLTAETLSGIPSIVYGLFGYLFFVIACKMGNSLLSGILTLTIMILPLIMRTTEEALKSVPDAYREGSFGLGAGRLRTVFCIVLPSAAPGILAGVILGIGRIVGETAALIYTSGTVAGVPKSLMGSGRTLAVHMYALLSEGFYTEQAYATAVVLLVMVVGINTLSAMVAKRVSVRSCMNKFQIEELNLYYGQFHALKNITMGLESGGITAFIGPSGCGKSTLLKTLNRMNDLVEGCRIEGRVLLDGEDIYGEMDPSLLRKRVGMVFQKPNPFPMSIYDNIAFGPRTHGVRSKVRLDEIVEQSLKNAAIWDEVKDRLKKSALSLSGGQQQRLCIARALAVQPEVLLMDEPTSALDPISTSKIEELVTELKKDYTIVIVTHNMQQAARISDKTAFFLLGEMVEYAPTEQLFSLPSDKRTEDYITGRFG